MDKDYSQFSKLLEKIAESSTEEEKALGELLAENFIMMRQAYWKCINGCEDAFSWVLDKKK